MQKLLFLSLIVVTSVQSQSTVTEDITTNSVLGANQLVAHATTHQEKYQSISKKGLDQVIQTIFNWIKKGGILWDALDHKQSITKDEITHIFWFLYSQGLLQGLMRTGPEEYSYVLDASTKGPKLFSLLLEHAEKDKQGHPKKQIGSYLKAEGFVNQKAYEITLWSDEEQTFLPLGMKTILFMSAEYKMPEKKGQQIDIRELFLFKPKDSSSAKTSFFNMIKNVAGSGKGLGNRYDQPKYQTEHLPAFLTEKTTPIFANTNEQDQTLIEIFYNHLRDRERRIGNEISINELTDQAAALYAGKYPPGTSTNQLDTTNKLHALTDLNKQYTANRLQSMLAWADYLFNQSLGLVKNSSLNFTKMSQYQLYNNIVAEVIPKGKDQTIWNMNREEYLKTKINENNPMLNILIKKLEKRLNKLRPELQDHALLGSTSSEEITTEDANIQMQISSLRGTNNVLKDEISSEEFSSDEEVFQEETDFIANSGANSASTC